MKASFFGASIKYMNDYILILSLTFVIKDVKVEAHRENLVIQINSNSNSSNTMLLDIIEVKNRLESPNNLMNRLNELRSKRSNQLSKIVSIPEIKPKIDELVDDIEDKLAKTNSKSHAMAVMSRCLAKLEIEIEEVPATKLAAVAKDMSLVIKNLEPESKESLNQIQFHIYSPAMKQESDFHTINVSE